jgi:hypothetical protein
MTSPSLPSASSPSLILTHPTTSEIQYTHQLASHLNITHWILTPAEPPGNRLILASCETIEKRCLFKSKGEVEDGVVHAVAAVFCERGLRRRGYAGRMLRELRDVLGKYGEGCGVGSVLWSDIGPNYYSGMGWKAYPSFNLELPALRYSEPSLGTVKPLLAEDLAGLCEDDEAMLRASMGETSGSNIKFAVVPDHRTILWHHMKEEYICNKFFFEKSTDVKGAVAGEVGERIWVIWTRAFYGTVDDPEAGNRLYILRLVVESLYSGNEAAQIAKLEAVLQAAQSEAEKWKLPWVEVWNPEPKIRKMIESTALRSRFVERETEGIPSLLWFGDGGGHLESIQWIANEKFAWC